MAYKHFFSWPPDGERIYLSAVFCYGSTIVLLTYGKIFYSRGGKNCVKFRHVYYEQKKKWSKSPARKNKIRWGM